MGASANRYEEDATTESNEEPTQDWQRRWNVGMILRHNARHQDDPIPLHIWVTIFRHLRQLEAPSARDKN